MIIFYIADSEKEPHATDLNLQHSLDFNPVEWRDYMGFHLNMLNAHVAFVPGNTDIASRLKSYIGPALSDRIDLQWNTKSELDKYMNSFSYARDGNPLYHAVVYLDNMVGPQYDYTVRMNSTEFSLKYRSMTSTKQASVDRIRIEYDTDWELYTHRGFSFLQTAIDSFILHDTQAFPMTANKDPTLEDVGKALQLTLQPFPTPEYTFDPFATYVASLLGNFFSLVFVLPIVRIVSAIVEEKELKIKQGMMMMGLHEGSLTLSWVITYIIMFILSCGAITGITSFNMYQNSSPILIFCFFFFYCFAIFGFSLFMAALFSKARTGATFSAVVHIMLFSFYYLVNQEDASVNLRNFVSLISPTVAVALGGSTMSKLESTGLGVTFDTLTLDQSGWSVMNSLSIFLISGVFYTCLAMYLQKVMPTDYGVVKKWYFLCVPRFWCGTPRNRETGVCSCFFSKRNQGTNTSSPSHDQMSSNLLSHTGMNHHSDNPFYSYPTLSHVPLVNEEHTHMEPKSPSAMHRAPLIQTRGLRKVYPSETDPEGFVAVKGLSVDMMEGQVFALLGENGAGKSTTINCLIGGTDITSGTAYVNGYDCATEMDAIRQCQGVCMQHDILYPYLSVKEHLELYAAIKGMSKDKIETEVQKMVDEVGLGQYGDNKLHALAGTLSGGQMRKLSVGIALLNNPKIVYLDEPSSGMDVASQRFIWEVILRAKEGRTIVLTSHFMEEVETLGDTIAIMAGGKLMCCGSSLYLKEQFGVGYTLTIVKSETTSLGKASNTLTSSSAQATTKEGQHIIEYLTSRFDFLEFLYDAGSEISFRMPLDRSEHFPDLFDLIESEKKQLHINSYGISATTMTEVFLRAISNEQREEAYLDHHPVTGTTNTNTSTSSSDASTPTVDAPEIDWDAIDIQRKQVDNSGVFKTHLFTMLYKRFRNAKRDKKTWLWTTLYPTLLLGMTLLSLHFAISSKFPVKTMGPDLFDQPNYIPYVPRADPELTTFHDIYANLSPNNQLVAIPAPSDATEPDREYVQDYLVYTIHEYATRTVRTNALNIEQLRVDPQNSILSGTMHFNYTAPMSVPSYLSAITNTLLRMKNPDASITCRAQPFEATQKQKSFSNASVSFGIGMAMAFVSATYVGYLVKEREENAKSLQLISGVTPSAYWLGNYIWDVVNYIFPCVCVYLLLFIFGTRVLTEEGFLPFLVVTILFGLSSAPIAYCFSFLFKSSSIGQNTTVLFNFFTGVLLLIVVVILNNIESTRDAAKYVRFFFRIFPSYCFSDAVAMITLRKALFPKDSLWSMNIVGWDCLFMVLDMIIYYILLVKIEFWSTTNTLDWILGGCRSYQHDEDYEIPTINDDMDEDVIAEQNHVKEYNTVPNTDMNSSNYPIIIHGLRKVYPSRMNAKPHVAVNNLYLSVQKGHCMGLLGPNGGGKSTTIKALLGEITCTNGTAILAGHDIRTEMTQCRQHIGYVPQFDALMPLLTGREHLELYARIKLIPQPYIPVLIEYLLKKLGLTHLADRPSGTYSGGNKRKLSLGLTLIGNPSVVFLDEPTTGVDPASRRAIWKLITDTMNDKAVVLTTHNMEEAEALCDRITILCSGELRAIGTAQHLKTKYGDGWQVVCRAEQPQPVVQWFTSTFANVTVIEQHELLVKLKVPFAPGLSLGKFFRLVEDHKQSIGLQTYSVSEYTVEQIFINFVQADVARKARELGITERPTQVY